MHFNMASLLRYAITAMRTVIMYCHVIGLNVVFSKEVHNHLIFNEQKEKSIVRSAFPAPF
jgi:hypothetical protein